MTKQVIGTGASANDKKGDSLRAAFTKVNANFDELYTAIGGGAGTTDRLTKGALTVTLGSTGVTTFPLFNTDPGNLFIQGPEIGSSNSAIGISTIDRVIINTNVTGSANQWTFDTDGTLAIPGGSITKTTNNNLSSGVATQVVWTSTEQFISGVKLTIQVECGEGSGSWEVQVCEAVIAAKGFNSSTEPVMTVYGVTHTSVSPLMTFAVDRNIVNNLIEIIGTRTGTANPNGNASLRIYSVESGTND